MTVNKQPVPLSHWLIIAFALSICVVGWKIVVPLLIAGAIRYAIQPRRFGLEDEPLRARIRTA